MQQELIDLYEELKTLKNDEEDLAISEPNDDDEQEYICFEQDIIHYNDGVYDISCLYNLHPTFKFTTKEEVLSFFEGYTNGRATNDISWGFKIWAVDNVDIEENAYNIGYYAHCLVYLKKLETEILPKYLNEKQHIWGNFQH